jgi:hypothetical protein
MMRWAALFSAAALWIGGWWFVSALIYWLIWRE